MSQNISQFVFPRRLIGLMALMLIALYALMLVGETAMAQQIPQGQPGQPEQIPGAPLGYDSDFWRAVREGRQGTVSIPDKQAGVLVQSEGDNWRALRNGPLSVYGGWALLGIVVLLAIFFTIRGRIKIDGGWSKTTILRFNTFERTGHWLLAISFIVLAITGLNILYGRYVLLPLISPEAFATFTVLGKYAHNYVAFAFMLGLVWIFLTWIKHNFPNRHDFVWLAKGGGVLIPGTHAPAKKFNAGQKIIFWLVIVGGVSLSMSGIALLFPFQFAFFSDTSALLMDLGIEHGFPTEFTPLQEQQLNQIWHAAVALGLTVVVIAHIYIGSIGMQGAFSAMGTGNVDANWAKEHHPIWVDELKEKSSKRAGKSAAGSKAPAE